MSLNIMIAGCSRDERQNIEASVKAAFGERADAAPWNVSLVHVANQWSIEIDGPEPRYRGLSLVAPASELTNCLREALLEAGNGHPENGSGGTAAIAEDEHRDRHTCEECAVAFDVLYGAVEGELSDLFPVACPQCWHVNKVSIAEGAGANGDYRAQLV